MVHGFKSMMVSLLLSIIVLMVVYIMHRHLQTQVASLKSSIGKIEARLDMAGPPSTERCASHLSGPDKMELVEAYQDERPAYVYGGAPATTEMFEVNPKDDGTESTQSDSSTDLDDAETFTVNEGGMASVIEVPSKDVRQFDQGNTVCFCIPKSSITTSPIPSAPGSPRGAAKASESARVAVEKAINIVETKQGKTIEPFVEHDVYAVVRSSSGIATDYVA